MTTVGVSCSNCSQDFKLATEAVLLSNYDNGHSDYAWECPGCHLVNERVADARARKMLGLAHVLTREIHVPFEFLEPKSGATITDNELLDFVIQLRQTWTMPPARFL